MPYNARIGLIGVLLISSVLITLPSRAFHDGIRSCEDGEIGYLATMIAEQGISYMFLSSEEPATTDSVLCQIKPQQLVQVRANSQGL